MTISMTQVRAALDPDEPSYKQAAQKLGPEALPHLAEIIRDSDEGLAAKAVYLASLIPSDGSSAVVASAATRPEATVRVAVAAGASNLPPGQRSSLLVRLLDDHDIGVRKLALRAVAPAPDAALAAKVEALARSEPEPALRSLAQEKLDQRN